MIHPSPSQQEHELSRNEMDRLSHQKRFGGLTAEHVVFGPGFIRDRIGEFEFKIHPNAFFQTNTAQAERLYDIALDFAELQEGDIVYDLYCGVGTLSLYMSQKASKVLGIELVDVAVENAKFNALENKVENVSFVRGDMKDVFTKEMVEEYGAPDVLITDPPRAGMHPDVVDRLCELRVPKIVYVSCDSSTMARDLKVLSQEYEINVVQPVDMQQAGIKVAIRTNDTENSRNLPYNAGYAASFGMGREEALKAITINAAEIMGIGDELGSIEVGKRANIFVATGDPFETTTQILDVFIDGYQIPMTSRQIDLYNEFLNRVPGLNINPVSTDQ